MNIFKLVWTWCGEHFSSTTIRDTLGLVREQLAKSEREKADVTRRYEKSESEKTLLQKQNEELNSSLLKAQIEIDDLKKRIATPEMAIPIVIPMNPQGNFDAHY